MFLHCVNYNAETDFDFDSRTIPHEGNKSRPEIVLQMPCKRYRGDDDVVRTLSSKLEAIIASTGLPANYGGYNLSYVLNEFEIYLKRGFDDSVFIDSGIMSIIGGYTIEYLLTEFPKYFKGFQAPHGPDYRKKQVFIDAFVEYLENFNVLELAEN